MSRNFSNECPIMDRRNILAKQLKFGISRHTRAIISKPKNHKLTIVSYISETNRQKKKKRKGFAAIYIIKKGIKNAGEGRLKRKKERRIERTK